MWSVWCGGGWWWGVVGWWGCWGVGVGWGVGDRGKALWVGVGGRCGVAESGGDVGKSAGDVGRRWGVRGRGLGGMGVVVGEGWADGERQ